jgi:uncharacterized membrane protein HdeD (DUF308 family)
MLALDIVLRVLYGLYREYLQKAYSLVGDRLILRGVIDLTLGYILLAHPGMTLTILPFMIGFWGAFYGVFLVIDTFSGTGSMGLKIISGILIFILANVIMFNPVSFGLTLAIWIGVMLLFAGIYNIIVSFSLK